MYPGGFWLIWIISLESTQEPDVLISELPAYILGIQIKYANFQAKIP